MTLKQYLHSVVWVRRRLFEQIPRECQFLLSFVSKNDVCLDIGAHSGSWTVPLARRCRSGRVYAFEALPYYADVLQLTLRVLGCWNVTLVKRAVMDNPGKVNVVSRDSEGRRLTGRTHVAASRGTSDGVSVEAISLDSYRATAESDVRFVKADIEGVELLAFRGAERLISRARPLVFCEVDDEYCRRYGFRAADVFQFFAERNYTPFQIVGASQATRLHFDKYSGKGDVLFASGRDAALLEGHAGSA